MKKLFFLVTVLAITVSAEAQVKVYSNGNVWIGPNAANSSQKLTIDGSVRFRNWIDVTYDVTGDNNVPVFYPSDNYGFQLGKSNYRANAIYSYNIWLMRQPNVASDEKIKENITKIEKPIEKIKQISGYYYNLKREIFPKYLSEEAILDMTKTQIGFLAQEVEKEFPELVTKPESETDFCSMDYTGMIPILVEAIKEQQKMIENLQQEVKNQKEALDARCSTIKSTSMEMSNNQTIQQFDLSGNTEVMKIYQNAPNPFNETTTIQCYIPQVIKKVQLCIYDMSGTQIKCLTVSGRETTTIQVQAGQLAAGVYTYLLIGDGRTSEAKQMILTK